MIGAYSLCDGDGLLSLLQQLGDLLEDRPERGWWECRCHGGVYRYNYILSGGEEKV